tara:strand:- start:3 stop:479 length:477 start_codon:yes stop_codon:yes gene_type:complete
MEIWKDVKGYEGSYQVSDLGRVKSCKRKDELILKVRFDKDGYSRVNLYNKSKPKTFMVYSLVAVAFLKHTPCAGVVVDHINNKKTDNSLENLQLITPRENCSKDRKGSSDYTGVSWHKASNKWTAQINITGKVKYLGVFVSQLDAFKVYKKELNKLIS